MGCLPSRVQSRSKREKQDDPDACNRSPCKAYRMLPAKGSRRGTKAKSDRVQDHRGSYETHPIQKRIGYHRKFTPMGMAMEKSKQPGRCHAGSHRQAHRCRHQKTKNQN